MSTVRQRVASDEAADGPEGESVLTVIS